MNTQHEGFNRLYKLKERAAGCNRVAQDLRNEAQILARLRSDPNIAVSLKGSVYRRNMKPEDQSELNLVMKTFLPQALRITELRLQLKAKQKQLESDMCWHMFNQIMDHMPELEEADKLVANPYPGLGEEGCK